MSPAAAVRQAGVLARDAAGAPRATPTMASAAGRRTRRYSGCEPRRLGAGSGRTGGRSFAPQEHAPYPTPAPGRYRQQRRVGGRAVSRAVASTTIALLALGG